MVYEHEFDFGVGAEQRLNGLVQLEEASEGPMVFREGKLSLASGRGVELFLTHSAATDRFMYLGDPEDFSTMRGILDTLGIEELFKEKGRLPGQFIVGAARAKLVMQGVEDCMRSPAFQSVFADYGDGELLAVPILREGMKYGLTEALLGSGGRVCDEIVADAHHVEDKSVPGLGRRMDLKIFKDRDLNQAEREAVKVIVLGDSVASGTVIVGMVGELADRFPNLERVELVAPLAAIFGLARIAAFARAGVEIRIHSFETLLNVLAPDYYYSPHFEDSKMHINPASEAAYRRWWGQDAEGRWIADTACAGYGWSEAFFNPGKQLRMIEGELVRRHGLTIADLARR